MKRGGGEGKKGSLISRNYYNSIPYHKLLETSIETSHKTATVLINSKRQINDLNKNLDKKVTL